jgi:hypothetical protein
MQTNGLPEGSRTFPLLAGTKRPAGGRGHLDASVWHVPEGNYGVALDGQFLVVDIDDPDRVPEDFHERLYNSPTWTQNTRRGAHFLFTVPEGFKGTNAQIPGLAGDLKVNGYIVGPGSEVEGHIYTVRDSARPQPAPKWLLDLVGEKRQTAPNYSASNTAESPLSLGEGEGRNQFLVRVAGLLRGQGLGVDQAKDAVRGINASVCVPPVSESELCSTIFKSVEKWNQGVVEFELGILPANMLQASAQSGIREPLSYMIRPLIPKVGLTLMHGKGGVGKSTFASFVTAQATKREIRCLLLCTEEDPILHRQRAEHMGADSDYIYWPDPSKVNVSMIKFPKNAGELDVLIQEIGIGFVYIDGIQTHADASSSKGMHAGEKARVLLADVAALAIKHDIAILGTFHNVKNSDIGMGSEELGNTARQQLSATAIGEGDLKRLNVEVDKSNGNDIGKVVQFSWHSKEYQDKLTGEFQEAIWEDDIDAEDFRAGYSELKRAQIPYLEVVKKSEATKVAGVKDEDVKDVVSVAILDALASGDWVYSTILKPLVMASTVVSESSVQRALGDLLEEGKISRTGKIQYTAYRKVQFVTI